jgi:hypothetical protein
LVTDVNVIKSNLKSNVNDIRSNLLTYLLTRPLRSTGTLGLNFTIVEVSIAVKFFTETRLLALCSNTQRGGVPILVAFYDMHGLQWVHSFPLSPHGERVI